MRLITIVNRALLCVGICFFCDFQTFAQKWDPSKIIPPSPNAESFGNYDPYKISYNTGLPEIKIPLFNVKTKDHALDIALSYNASGVKAAQQATWVGLGWSLIGGGAITRIVRGSDDLQGYYAYNNTGPLPPAPPYNNPINDPAHKSEFDEFYFGRGDSEPDIFNYHFGNYSGSFVLGKKADGSIVYFDEQNDLSFSFSTTGWLATDGRGYKYYFLTGESSKNYVYSSSAGQVSPTPALTPFTFQSINSTAWYLDKIESPNGDVINFNYVRGESLSLINMSETQFDRKDPFLGCPTGGDFKLYYKSFDASRQLTQDVYLQSINYKGGSIEFATTPRKDIDYIDQSKVPAKLSVISQYDYNHTLLKSFTLNYSYFKDNNLGDVTATDQLRLKLLSVTETGESGAVKPPYVFNYFSDADLPGKYAKGIDHWGYYNGKLNSRLLPMPSDLKPASYLANNDADREADENGYYAKAATLQSVTYPTGGRTEYDFEQHTYGNLFGSDAFKTEGTGDVVSSSPYDQSRTSVSFDITPADVNLNGIASISFTWSYLYIDGPQLFANQTQLIGNLSGPSSYTFDNTALRASDPQGKGGTQSITFTIPIGHYTMSVRNFPGHRVYIQAYWQHKVPVTEKKGGGLRVKTIKTYDGSLLTDVKNYTYIKDNKTSGILINRPLYGYNCPKIELSYNSCFPTDSYICRMSGSAFPQGLSSKGGIVGYDLVTETQGINGGLGKKEYYFINAAQIRAGYPGTEIDVPGLPLRDYPFTGRLRKEINYDASGRPLKELQYFNSIKQTSSLPGFQIYQGPPIPKPQGFNDQTAGIIPYNVYFYKNESNWVVLDSTKQIDYFYEGSITKQMITKHQYFYDNPKHLQQTRDLTTKSNGITNLAVTLFPDDFGQGNGFIADLITAHQTSLPIETVNYILKGNTTQITSGQIIQYKSGGKALVDKILKLTGAPKDINNFKLSNAGKGKLPFSEAGGVFSPDPSYGEEVKFNEYDDAGNPVMVSPRTSSPYIFIWSYQKRFPIALVQNADYANIVSVLGGSAAVNTFANINPSDLQVTNFLNPLRTALQAGQSKISSYTYKPFGAMSSTLDAGGELTSYEYDSFQRLKNIKDKDGSIVKNFKYNFQQPQAVVFWNAPREGSFTKNCSSGVGSTEIYKVDGHTYSGSSQAEADAKAQADVNANGQNYANASGTCQILPYAAIVQTSVVPGASSNEQGYAGYSIRLFSDANYTTPYIASANVTVNYRLRTSTVVNNGTPTVSTSNYSIIIPAGSSYQDMGSFPNGCGTVAVNAVARSSTQQQTTKDNSTANALPPGGNITCVTQTLFLLEGIGYVGYVM